MKSGDFQQKLHLLSRSGFGISPAQWEACRQTGLKELLVQIETVAKKSVQALVVLSGNIDPQYRREKGLTQLTPEDRREINRQNVDKLKQLTILWMQSMINPENQLREKMALFWHGHFACRMTNAYFQQNMLHSIRQHALGNFGDLLRETSKSAAMLNFLNNQQNKKAHPNENFAREVMELFTMGRGHYTETDVKEAARSFTGWTYDANGNFQFNAKTHDNGMKTVLGKTGNFDGEAVLQILLENENTAHFITTKIYRYLVNEQIDSAHVNWLAHRFYQSHYDISALLHDIFTSSWFYKKENRGAIIKSPVDLLVNIQRSLPMKVENPEALLIFNNALGQMPFYPPNVAGWPGGTNWIDSSSLMLRLKIPQLIEENEDFHISTKQDDDIQMGRKLPAESIDSLVVTTGQKGKKPVKKGNRIEADIDWETLLQTLSKVPDNELFGAIVQIVLGPVSDTKKYDVIRQKVPLDADRKKYVQNLMVSLMCTPEFQLS